MPVYICVCYYNYNLYNKTLQLNILKDKINIIESFVTHRQFVSIHDIYIYNRDSTEKFSSNSGFKSEYFNFIKAGLRNVQKERPI